MSSKFRPGTLSSNRGNDLLIKLLMFRYPHIIDATTLPTLRAFLNADVAERKEMTRNLDVSNDPCLKELKKHASENSNSFPMLVGRSWTGKKKSQIALRLVSIISTKNTFLFIGLILLIFCHV